MAGDLKRHYATAVTAVVGVRAQEKRDSNHQQL